MISSDGALSMLASRIEHLPRERHDDVSPYVHVYASKKSPSIAAQYPGNCLQGKIPEIPVGGNGDRKERGRIGFKMPSAERPLATQVVADYGT